MVQSTTPTSWSQWREPTRATIQPTTPEPMAAPPPTPQPPATLPHPPANTNSVSQSELERLKRLRQELKELDAKAKELRDSIVERLEQGASVEQGPRFTEIRILKQRYYGREILKQLLGRAQEHQLHEQVPPRVTSQLLISLDPGRSSARETRNEPSRQLPNRQIPNTSIHSELSDLLRIT